MSRLEYNHGSLDKGGAGADVDYSGALRQSQENGVAGKVLSLTDKLGMVKLPHLEIVLGNSVDRTDRIESALRKDDEYMQELKKTAHDIVKEVESSRTADGGVKLTEKALDMLRARYLRQDESKESARGEKGHGDVEYRYDPNSNIRDVLNLVNKELAKSGVEINLGVPKHMHSLEDAPKNDYIVMKRIADGKELAHELVNVAKSEMGFPANPKFKDAVLDTLAQQIAKEITDNGGKLTEEAMGVLRMPGDFWDGNPNKQTTDHILLMEKINKKLAAEGFEIEERDATRHQKSDRTEKALRYLDLKKDGKVVSASFRGIDTRVDLTHKDYPNLRPDPLRQPPTFDR